MIVKILSTLGEQVVMAMVQMPVGALKILESVDLLEKITVNGPVWSVIAAQPSLKAVSGARLDLEPWRE